MILIADINEIADIKHCKHSSQVSKDEVQFRDLSQTRNNICLQGGHCGRRFKTDLLVVNLIHWMKLPVRDS